MIFTRTRRVKPGAVLFIHNLDTHSDKISFALEKIPAILMAVADETLDIRLLRELILPDTSEGVFELRGCWSPRLGIKRSVNARVHLFLIYGPPPSGQ